MKNTLTKILALLLVFSFVFVFAACNNDKKETTTAAATTMEETKDDATTAAVGETTTATGETTTAAATLPGETTTAAAAITAPVGSDIVKIVAFYNQCANATKAYNGTVKATKYDGTNTTINTISPDVKALRDQANKMLPNDYEKKADVTFSNGKAATGTETLVKYLPRDSEAKMSVLEPAGVKSATCTVSGSVWNIVIYLKSETVNGLNSTPKYHAQCMDTLSMTDDDLKPFKLTGNPTVTYTDATFIKCSVNANGLLTVINIAEPAQIKGTLSWTIFNLIKLDVTGTWKQDITLSY